jgi:hypothetical protein
VIPAQFTVAEIRQRVLQHLAPKMVDLVKGFNWDWKCLVLREVSNWYDLSCWPPDKPYFYDRFLELKGKSKTPSFKKPKAAIQLALVVDHDQYSEVDSFMEQLVVRSILNC